MGSSVIVEQESLKHGEKIIPHEILTKRYLERNKKLDNQKIREDNKRTTKPTQIRRHELWKGNTKSTYDVDEINAEDKQGKENISERSGGTPKIQRKGLDAVTVKRCSTRGAHHGTMGPIRNTFERWITW